MSFNEKLNRLKSQLNIATDTQVAKVLGMGQKAFISRKGRGSFPEDKLLALKARRPDLNLDCDYILTGQQPETTQARRLAAERRRVGLTVKRFAAAAGVSLETLLEWISGMSGPSLHQLDKLAQAGVDTCYVVTGTRSAASAPNLRTCMPAAKLDSMAGRAYLCEQVELARERAGDDRQAVVMVALLPKGANVYDLPEQMPNLPIEHINITQLPADPDRGSPYHQVGAV